MKVLFLTNVPSPYRVDFFNELGKYCDLTVLFEKRTSDERDNSWKNYKFENFNGVLLQGKSVATDTAFCPGVIKYVLNKSYDRIICASFAYPTGMLAIQFMKMFHIPYYLECDGGFAKNGKGIKEKLKKYFITGAEGYFSTGRTCDEYYCTYGADLKKIIRYPFTSLNNSDIIDAPVSLHEKEKLRNKLGIREKKVVLTVGQFIHRKGFDILLHAMTNMPKSIGVYFVGGKPTEEYLEMKKKYDLTNAHFVGFKSKEELSDYYKAADIFVLPTREDIWGLVVEEAMAYGLPVISTDNCAAALELIESEKNGYIIPVEDSQSLTTEIKTIVYDDSRQKMFSRNNLNKIQNYTIEKMVERHLEVLSGNNR